MMICEVSNEIYPHFASFFKSHRRIYHPFRNPWRPYIRSQPVNVHNIRNPSGLIFTYKSNAFFMFDFTLFYHSYPSEPINSFFILYSHCFICICFYPPWLLDYSNFLNGGVSMYTKTCSRCYRPSFRSSKQGKWNCPICNHNLATFRARDAGEAYPSSLQKKYPIPQQSESHSNTTFDTYI